MLKSEMQHQFWVTKKAVQRKFGSKEDECIISSDAELDAKIELFKSISASCGHLYRIIDNYQERVCILAQEENSLGKFLKETGKNSNTTGKIMASAGKAVLYCGQQRMMLRPPLLRLHHEVETFRGRAIADTQTTIISMERERTEYRAALSWMKSASAQLDPDSGRGVDKFRKAQTHVRLAKAKFDRLSLDCLQKIDLLAAARCNMFSHALVAYMSALLQYATKSSETFKATAKALANSPQYNFCILKDLTQVSPLDNEESKEDVTPLDSDQMLFFLDEYKDIKSSVSDEASASKKDDLNVNSSALIDISSSSETNEILKSTTCVLDSLSDKKDNIAPVTVGQSSQQPSIDLLGICDDFGDFTSHLQLPPFMPSQLLLDDMTTKDSFMPIPEGNPQKQIANESDVKNKNSILEFFNRVPQSKGSASTSTNIGDGKQKLTPPKKSKDKRKDMSAWFQLFSELDPLANPDTMARAIEGGKENSQAA